MTFVQKTWADDAAGGTPITAAELNRIEQGVSDGVTGAGLATVAKTGNYSDLNAPPVLAPVATSGSYGDLTGAPVISTAGHTGDYADLTNRPVLATVATSGAYGDLSGRPALATVATTAQYTDLIGAPAPGSGGGSDADFGAVLLDSFGGADDDTKLTNALAAVSADTYKRTILLQNRQYTFTTANRVAFSGMRIAGPIGYSNADKGAAYETSSVKLSMSGPWFTNNNANVYDVTLRNLAFNGTSGATVLGQVGATSSTSWWRLHMRDISASGLKGIVGSSAQALLVTGAHFDGFWEVNNSYGTAFYLGGSDSRLFTNGGFLDSGTAFNSTPGQAHLYCTFLDNTYVGPIYITAEGPWTAIQIEGGAAGSTGASSSTIVFNGCQIEGRNPSSGSDGALVRMNGGLARFRDCNFNYGMISPATAGRTPVDAGIIHHAGGYLMVDGAFYDRATGVAETVPLVYTASTGTCIVRSIQPRSYGGTWTGLPRFALKTGNTDNRIYDGTVTAITV